MRRLLAILLLLVLGLPELAPMYAAASASVQAADSQLPACCRRNGAHHCAMSAAERRHLLVSRVRVWSAPLERCPFCPRAMTVTAQGPIFAPPPALVSLPRQEFSSPYRCAPVARCFAVVLRAHGARGPPRGVRA